MKPKLVVPIFIPLFSFILGITWQQVFIPNLVLTSVALLIAMCLIAVLFICTPESKNNSLFAILCAVLLCFFAGAYRIGSCVAQRNGRIQAFANHKGPVVGIVTNLQPKEECDQSSFIDVTCDQGTLRLYARYNFDCTIDDTVAIEAHALRNIAHQDPEFARYLMREEIDATVFPNKSEVLVLNHPKSSWARSIHEWRSSCTLKGLQSLSRTTQRLFGTIFLGKKTYMVSDPLRETFMHWGLSHYLARSGLHITLLIITIQPLLQLIPAPMIIKHIFLLLFCLLYTIFSWSSISFIRSLFFFVLNLLGIALIARQKSSLHLLGLTCYAILMYNPFHLFFVDFQLSYALTAALVATAPFMVRDITYARS